MRNINTKETYEQQLEQAIWEWLEENCDAQSLLNDNCGCFNDVYDYLYDILFDEDCITGNASGFYSFCRESAKAMVLNNIEDVMWALLEYGIKDKLPELIYDKEWERLDVIARCYYMGFALRSQLEEFLGGYDYE